MPKAGLGRYVDVIEFFLIDDKFDSTERYRTSPSDNSGHGLNKSKAGRKRFTYRDRGPMAKVRRWDSPFGLPFRVLHQKVITKHFWWLAPRVFGAASVCAVSVDIASSFILLIRVM